MDRVFVGLSGGVDSAVSAALLKKAGYDVTGVFIKIWQPTFLECTWEKDRLDAMRVAVALGIPFKEVDLSDEYERQVVREMVDSYAKGITPNPDVTCNEKIKFGSFYQWARAEGAGKVATGHYARIEDRQGMKLVRGADLAKDQSYFLYRIPRESLAHVLFPIGGFAKSEVRRIARSLQLPVAHKNDSQGLCFVGDVNMRDFLMRYIAVEKGDVLDMQGNRIGKHDGAALYTVGQRHGFTARTNQQHYVVRIDATANTITVSPRKTDCASRGAQILSEHWLCDLPRVSSLIGQSRYREAPFSLSINQTKLGWEATFDEPHIVSPGQSLVLYDGDICIGGGLIGASVHSAV